MLYRFLIIHSFRSRLKLPLWNIPDDFSSVSNTTVQLGRSLIRNSEKKKKKWILKESFEESWLKAAASLSSVSSSFFFREKYGNSMFRVVKFVKLRSVIFENFRQVGGSSGSRSSSIIETVDVESTGLQLGNYWPISGQSSVNDHLFTR